MTRRRTRRPAVALALAGGGPFGAVYELGALLALEDSIAGLRQTLATLRAWAEVEGAPQRA